MTSPHSRDAVIPLHIQARCLQTRKQSVIVQATQCRMSLPCGTKFSLNAQMNLHGPARKPAAASLRQLRRLRNFVHPQQPAVERPCPIFTACGHGKLDVINRREWMTYHPTHLPDPHQPPHRLNQLRRIVSHAVFENRLDVFNVLNLFRRIALNHHQVRLLP